MHTNINCVMMQLIRYAEVDTPSMGIEPEAREYASPRVVDPLPTVGDPKRPCWLSR